jgi:hypothetical protein
MACANDPCGSVRRSNDNNQHQLQDCDVDGNDSNICCESKSSDGDGRDAKSSSLLSAASTSSSSSFSSALSNSSSLSSSSSLYLSTDLHIDFDEAALFSRVNIRPTHPDRRADRMPLFACKTIRHGEELFVAYGRPWWDAFPSPGRWATAIKQNAQRESQILSASPSSSSK